MRKVNKTFLSQTFSMKDCFVMLLNNIIINKTNSNVLLVCTHGRNFLREKDKGKDQIRAIKLFVYT